MKKLLIFILLSTFLFSSWKSQIGVHFNYKKVNDIQEMNIIGENIVNYETNGFKLDTGAICDLQENDGVWLNDYGFRLSGGYAFNNTIKFYILGLYDVKQSLQLSFRLNAGVGAKYTYIKNESSEMSISLIPLYNLEKYDNSTDNNEDYVRLSFRSKLIFSFFDEQIQLKSIIFYKPLLSDISQNYIIDSDHTISLQLGKDLFLDVKHMLDVERNKDYNIDGTKSLVTIGARILFY